MSCFENIVTVFSHFSLKFINAMQFVKCFDFDVISFSYRMALTWKKILQFCSCGLVIDRRASIYKHAI